MSRASPPAVLALSITFTGLSVVSATPGYLPEAALPEGWALAGEPRTLVFYESGRRIADSVRDCARVFGQDRPAALARELTKAHESVYRETLAELGNRLERDPEASLGECVLVVAGAPESAAETADLERALRVLLEFVAPSAAARIAAQIYGVSRRAAYAAAMRLSGADKGRGPV